MTNANAPINIPQSFSYTPSNYNSVADLAQAKSGNVDTSYDEAPSAPIFTVKQLAPGLWYWKVIYYDGRGGFKQRGRFDEMHAATSQSTTDRRYKGQETLPLKMTQQASLAPTSATNGKYGMLSVEAFQSLLIAPAAAQVDGTNVAKIYTPTSSSNPALTQLTYSNGSNYITGLSHLTLNNVEYVAIFRTDQANLITDFASTPTSAGNISGGFGSCVGAMNTTLPDTAALFLRLQGFYSLAYNSDPLSVAPTLTSPIPYRQGGYALGLKSIGNGDLRCWWNLDKGNLTQNGIYNPIETYPGGVFSTNQRGTDLQELNFTMSTVPYSGFYRDGVWGGNGKALEFQNARAGDRPRDLRPFRDRKPNSDRLLYYTGIHIRGSDMYMDVNEIAAPGTSGATRYWREYYNWNADEWFSVSAAKTLTGTGLASGSPMGPTLPVNNTSGYLYNLTDLAQGSGANWYYQPQPPAGTNPYQYRRTSGSTSGTGVEWDSPAASTNPALTIPGLEGKAMTWHRMWYGGQMEEGTIDYDIGGTSVTDTVISQRETFTGPLTAASRWRRRQFNRNRFYELINTATLTQGADTRKTPQSYPYTIEGLAYDDDATFQRWSERGMVHWS